MRRKVRIEIDRICYLGMILIIVGSVSFSNYERIGDGLILVGAAIILTNKWISWRERTASI